VVKVDIVDMVHEKVGFTKAEAGEAVEAILRVIKETLQHGEAVQVVGFGSFTVRNKRERTGRNPKTGEEIKINPRRVLSFRPSQILRMNVNSFHSL